jgi:glycosyltransferase involved in cell wall biosynthesis
MLDAINIVNQQQKCHLWLIGSIEDYDLKDAQEHEAWTFVDYLGLLPQWKAFSYIIKSDVGLCVIPNTGDYGQTDPNKLYEYQVFGIPFIASNFEKWKTKLEKVQAGQFVEPNSPEAIAKAILWFINNPQRGKVMGKQGKKYVETEYNWEKESKKLCDCYRNLLSEP